jgi:phosphohistidine phosphatase SixA
LQPGSRLDELVAWSNEQGVDELAWVGHAPDVNALAGALMGAGSESLLFAKGAVAAITFDDLIERGLGQLRWFATPALLGC